MSTLNIESRLFLSPLLEALHLLTCIPIRFYFQIRFRITFGNADELWTRLEPDIDLKKKQDLRRSLLSSTQVVWNCSTVDKCGIRSGRGWQPLHKRVDFQDAHRKHRESDTKRFNPSCEVEFELRFLDSFATVDIPLFRLAPNRHESFVWFARQVSHRGLPR